MFVFQNTCFQARAPSEVPWAAAVIVKQKIVQIMLMYLKTNVCIGQFHLEFRKCSIL